MSVGISSKYNGWMTTSPSLIRPAFGEIERLFARTTDGQSPPLPAQTLQELRPWNAAASHSLRAQGQPDLSGNARLEDFSHRSNPKGAGSGRGN